MADTTEIPSAKQKFVWSRHALKIKLITIFCPTTRFPDILKMASKMAAENRKLNITYCMADKTEIPCAKRTFLWSRNAMETKRITICCPITKFAYTQFGLYKFTHFRRQR